ncbi:MAG: type 4a pilus biogenesis protein PilO [Gammaproteobacteria bacterium]|nr:type 4a pilus biogenesis protein PilO [Gammaproteobacteria bacterium]
MIDKIVNHVSPTFAPWLLLGMLCLMLTASYTYMFKASLKNYAAWKVTLAKLQEDHDSSRPLDSDIKNMQEQIDSLDRELNGSGPKLPANQMVAHVIGQLDEIAETHKVHLSGVRPGNISDVLMFSETPYHISIQGSYFNLFGWLHEVERSLGPLVIKEYEIENAENNKLRRMKLTMVSYRIKDTKT